MSTCTESASTISAPDAKAAVIVTTVNDGTTALRVLMGKRFDAAISARKLAVLARSSVELFEDSEPDLAEFVASEIGYAFAAKEDDCGFNGDGTQTYGGNIGIATRLTGMKSAVPS